MRVNQIEEFEELFEQAELNASKENEMAFIAGFRLKLEEFGDLTFISEKQLSWLLDIAERNSDR